MAATPSKGGRITGGEAFWSADTAEPLIDDMIGSLLSRRAAEVPDRVALIGVRHDDGQRTRLNYRHLHRQARRVAAGLAHIADPGARVALWAPNVIEWPTVEYGVALAGMVLVALDPTLREAELKFALQHSDAAVLVHAAAHHDYDMDGVAGHVGAQLSGLRRVSLSELFAEPAGGQHQRPPWVSSGDATMLQYTSGTTSSPKGVLLTHRAVVNVANLTMQAAGVGSDAVFCNPLPIFHTAGCVVATLGPLWLGAPVLLVDRFDADAILDDLADECVTALFYVPAMLAALTGRAHRGSGPPAALQVMMGGASQVEAALIDDAEATFGGTVLNLFGQTELAPVLSMTRPEVHRSDRLTTVGRPLPHLDCTIVDPVSGRTCAVGEVGEIRARGYQQFVEYVGDAPATAAAFDDRGFVCTGDLGLLDARGYLTVIGRLKEVIDRGGENISPAEVETRLVAHAELAACAVIGLPDERLGETVAAVIVIDDHTTGDTAPSREEIDSYAREHLVRIRFHAGGSSPTHCRLPPPARCAAERFATPSWLAESHR